MVKKFNQIQHCAIVSYKSPLTNGEDLVGIFYKKSWEFNYFLGNEWKMIKVTPSQKCTLICDSLNAILQVYMAGIKSGLEATENG